MDLRELQAAVGAWAGVNAPDATEETCFKHIGEEMKELAVELRAAREGVENTAAVEMADIIILLSHLACLLEVNLGDAVAAKWTIVVGRTYAKGDDGVYRHVKVSTPHSGDLRVAPANLFSFDDLPDMTDHERQWLGMRLVEFRAMGIEAKSVKRGADGILEIDLEADVHKEAAPG